ncbi:hypothetical protein EYF80_065752 [Liparis tanakae]|uniref:Uncharacterized protein n=1 Tax=Liparis tanakae TaxID=230148 RepID=A0A4Z2E5S4_9TELE|nr:hypothetical protein EYF80_065752 [Liparis tanakae]
MTHYDPPGHEAVLVGLLLMMNSSQSGPRPVLSQVEPLPSSTCWTTRVCRPAETSCLVPPCGLDMWSGPRVPPCGLDMWSGPRVPPCGLDMWSGPRVPTCGLDM